MRKVTLGAVVVPLLTAALGFAGGVGATARATRQAVAFVPDDQKWKPLAPARWAKGPEISPVLGDMKSKGPQAFLMKVPADFRPGLHTHAADYYGFVLKGNFHNYAGADEGPALIPGSWWMQPGGKEYPHDNHCEPGADCLLLIYNTDGFSFEPAAAHP
jgi:hypothetical protein